MTTINEQEYQRLCAIRDGAPDESFGAGKESGDYYGKFATHENGILTRFWAVWDGESWQACDECEEDVTLLSDIKTQIAMYEENQRLREDNANLVNTKVNDILAELDGNDELESPTIVFNMARHIDELGRELSSKQYERNHFAERVEQLEKDLQAERQRADDYAADFDHLLDVAEDCCVAKTKEEACRILSEFVDNTESRHNAKQWRTAQQTKGVEDAAAKLITPSVANHWCEKEQAGYMWCHSELLEIANQLRQQARSNEE